MNNDWYRNFFDGIVLEFSKIATPEILTKTEIDFILNLLLPAEGAEILDVPCGYGRHSIELAKRGFRTTGIDLSDDSIRDAKSTAASGAFPADFFVYDMENFNLGKEFDLAICLGNSFGYMDYKGNIEFLRNINRHLKLSGRFILNTMALAESIYPNYQKNFWLRFGNITLLVENEIDLAEARLITEYTFISGSRSEKRRSRQMIFTLGELLRLISDAGFSVVHIFGSTEMKPFAFGDSQVYIIAEKTERVPV